jgi:uncharacterized protein
MKFRSRRTARAAVAALAPLAAAALLACPASAHVKVSGVDVKRGGYGLLTFRVPTESDTASTTELRITLPSDTPLVSVATQPKAGWAVTVRKKDLPTPRTDDDGNKVTQYVAEVDFKATDPQAAIAPGQFDTFSISAGTLPDRDEVAFPTLQVYSDGTTVNWNERSADGTTEPQHPAPTLKLPKTDADTATAAGGDTTPAWPGWTGFGLGIGAVVLALAALVRARRRTP